MMLYFYQFYQCSCMKLFCKTIRVPKKLRVYDCRGIGPADGVLENDLLRVIEGNVMKNYEVH